MVVRPRALWPQVFVALIIAVAATIAAAHVYLGQFQARRREMRDFPAGTPLADQYAELPETAKPAPPPVILRARLNRTLTVEQYFITAGLNFHEARQWAVRFRELSGTNLLRKGHWFSVYKDPDNGDLRAIKYDLDDHVEIFERTLGDGVLRVHKRPINYITRSVAAAFEILGGFRRAASHHEVPAPIVSALEHTFSGPDDLNRMPHGAAVKIIYTEKVSEDGTHHIPGHIEAVEIESNGHKTMAFALEGRDGTVHLYDRQGRALGPQFLRYPVHFQYISSGFTYRRWHPILHCYRPHVGVDFAASRGTPVKSIADGRIVTAGWCGELGNCVRIQHRGDLVSIYGHLSRLSPDARAGRYVGMGEVIGYVGSTGLSTGPHLHFGLEKDGRYVNPLTQVFSVDHEVSPRMRTMFDRVKRRYETALAKLPDFTSQPGNQEEHTVRSAEGSNAGSYLVGLEESHGGRRYSHVHRAYRHRRYREHVIHTVENHVGIRRTM